VENHVIFLSLARRQNIFIIPYSLLFMKAIEVVYEMGIFKPTEKVNISEGAKFTVFLEDFTALDDVSSRAKRIVGEVSKKQISEILDEAWI
jgi:predicted DNA-binding antitoxin AbrB/MazE fold protein